MRSHLAIFILLVSACGDGTKRDPIESPADKVKTLDDLSVFQDFDLQMSQDGQRAAFTSRRDGGEYRTYLYAESAQAKLSSFAGLFPLEAGEIERNVALSDDGQWLLVEREGGGTHALLLSNWEGKISSRLPLAANSQVTSLRLYSGANESFLTFAERTASGTTVQVYSFDVSSAQTSQLGSFAGESRPLLALNSQGQLTLYSLAQNGSTYSWLYRVFDGSARSWSSPGTTTATLSQKGKDAPAAATEKGLFFAQALEKPKSKPKLGSSTDRPEGYTPDVGILDAIKYLDPFNTAASSVDFEAANYKPYQPSTISEISLSKDGAYALVTGNDTYFCKGKQLPLNFFQLVRLSDMATVPLFVGRSLSEANAPWNQILTDVCGVYDAAEPSSEVDGVISRAGLAGVDGDRFWLTYESQRSGDREVFRASFRVLDWSQKSLAETSVTNLSENHRL